MGLDISVSCTRQDVEDASGDWFDGDSKEMTLFGVACDSIGLTDCDLIRTRPGSYRGLHLVRAAFARLKGIDADGENTDWERQTPLGLSHLCDHSDCEGWYLPDDFERPIFAGDLSIGSSQRLLAELLQIDRESLDPRVRWAWDSVFVAAVASVATRNAIRFH